MKRLKKPSDYGQFFFRISKEEKDELEARIQTILDIQQSLVSEDELLPKRNHLILKAIHLGLSKIEKDLKKKA